MPSNPQVPKGWRRVRLDEVADVVMGQSPPGDTVFDWDGGNEFVDGLPFTQGNAEFGSQSPKPIKWCVRPAKVAEAGDLLISVRAPVGETNRAFHLLAIGRGLAAIRFRRADPAFGWHAVNSAKHTLERLAQGSTFDAIGGKELNSLSLLIPPADEQRAIAAVLDSIDEAIERTEEVIAATERLRDALLHDLLTRGLPGRHTEWKQVQGLGTIPACWDVVRLGDVCERITKGTTPTTLGHSYTPDGVRFLRVENINGGLITGGEEKFISWETHKCLARSVLRKDDILLSIAGALGRSALVDEERLPANVNQALAIVRLRPNGPVSPQYSSLCLQGSAALRQIEEMRAELAQANINLQQVGAIRVALPSQTEQREIAELICAVEISQVGKHQGDGALRSLKSSVADTLLTGTKRAGQRDGRKSFVD